MSEKYPFKDVEAKWQVWWEANGTYRAKNPDQTEAKKFYGLVEFPYPSGDGLHVGHPRSYTAIDILTRKKRMEGRNVLYPMGWDAFGLPAENFAIKNKKHPSEFTAKNVANFKRQIKMLGAGFDWEREINTTDPAYYKWTQWMFIRFFESWYDEKMGRARPIATLSIPDEIESQGEVAVREYRDSKRLAFKSKTTINWCPKDKIGLANEEAAGGVCDRCGGPVEKRVKEQWMLRITAYAERLINDLAGIDYLEKIKAQQINWIGRSEGAIIRFVARRTSQGSATAPEVGDNVTAATMLEVFTTRPDTLFGATYMVLAPEHELVKRWIEDGTVTNAKEIKAYQTAAKKKSDLERQENKEKTGVRLEGVAAINPATEKEIPIWIADYVLTDYGTGAIMAVPAHDERDYEFAQKFELPIVEVVTSNVQVAGFGALIQDESGKFYFQQRDGNAKRDPNMIAPFGGGKEGGEDILNCIKREIKEELDVEVDSAQIRTIGVFPSKNTPGQNLLMVSLPIGPVERTAEGLGVVGLTLDQALESDKVTEFTKEVLRFFKDNQHQASAEDGIAINSGFLDGLETAKAKEKIIAWLEKNGLGQRKVNFKLRDWVFSRQRYWGEPIPMTHCEHCGWVPLNDSQLPLLLPDVEDYEPTDNGDSPLATIKDWVKTKCAICGGEARRETDTMPGWAGSSWYFMRYCDPKNSETFASADALKYWMPVDLYNGGMEHVTLHLLYSRFWYKVLFDLGLIPEACGSEPYRARVSHAMIQAYAYQNKHGHLVPNDLVEEKDGKFKNKETGEELFQVVGKMSKSLKNVVNPDDVIDEFGSDVLRVYEMFIGPYDMDAPWSTQGIIGVRRFLDKVWGIGASSGVRRPGDLSNQDPGLRTQDLERLLNFTIKKVGEDIDAMRFNTAVSQLMILSNEFNSAKDITTKDLESFLRILAPFAPHLTEELWHKLGHEESIHLAPWPTYDPEKTKAQKVMVAVQVNGKVRGQIEVAADAEESKVLEDAKNEPNVKKNLDGKTLKKAIYVKGKIVSFVV